ncbi:MAG: hypothetical protein LBK27_04460 [Treponema sp.]|jgi:hypothetical protein|nr:hypothetical protein [Treponema sp.]
MADGSAIVPALFYGMSPAALFTAGTGTLIHILPGGGLCVSPRHGIFLPRLSHHRLSGVKDAVWFGLPRFQAPSFKIDVKKTVKSAGLLHLLF